jgi:hypothetical protein
LFLGQGTWQFSFLDKRKRPLMPRLEKPARLLLERGRAVVVGRYPFTIRLSDRVGGNTQPVRIKTDPGSGVAVRARGSFNIGSVQDVSAKYCTPISRGGGYGYNQEDAACSVGFRRQSPPR